MSKYPKGVEIVWTEPPADRPSPVSWAAAAAVCCINHSPCSCLHSSKWQREHQASIHDDSGEGSGGEHAHILDIGTLDHSDLIGFLGGGKGPRGPEEDGATNPASPSRSTFVTKQAGISPNWHPNQTLPTLSVYPYSFTGGKAKEY